MTIGIDYSMSCPAVCAYRPEVSAFWFCHATKLYNTTNLTSVVSPSGGVIHRASSVAHQVLAWLVPFNPETIHIEDYAFNATGRVFHIGEFAGVLKLLLFDKGINV